MQNHTNCEVQMGNIGQSNDRADWGKNRPVHRRSIKRRQHHDRIGTVTQGYLHRANTLPAIAANAKNSNQSNGNSY